MPKELIVSDATIRAIKPGDPRKRLTDGDGLYLLLFVKGGAHGWRYDYTFNGRRNTLSLGTYPDTGLRLARRKADELRTLIAEGKDPGELRKESKTARHIEEEARQREEAGLPPRGSFEAVAREWLEQAFSTKVSQKHVDLVRRRLERNVFPWVGRRPLASITAPVLLECLRRIEVRGVKETVRRMNQTCGQVFRYGIAIGACDRNPASDLRDALPTATTRHFSAITEPQRVGELLRALHGYAGYEVTRAALKLAPLVFQRPGELRRMEWSELDLDAAMWTIPAGRMKRSKKGKANGVPHLVPLSWQAVAILRDLQPLTGGLRYVFSGARTSLRPMSENTVNAALRRMDFPKEEMSGHGFRALARTLLAERLDIPDAVIEAQLAHSVKDPLGRAYNRTQYLEQRKRMMQLWSDYLDQLRDGAQVVPLRAA